MIKRFSKFVLLPIVAVLGPLFLTIAGCATSSNSGGTTPPTNSTGPNPIVVSAIQNGTSLAVSFGLPLAASATSATAVQADATLALTSVNGLLAVLNPSSVTASSTAALQTLVTQIVNGQVSSLSGFLWQARVLLQCGVAPDAVRVLLDEFLVKSVMQE